MRKYLVVLMLGLVHLLFSNVSNVSLQANRAFEIKAKSSNSVSINFRLPSYEFVADQLDGKSYSRIKMEGVGFTGDIGLPELPVLSTMVALPANGNVRIVAENVQQSKVASFNAYPFQDDRESVASKTVSIDKDFYLRGTSYPESVVRYGDPEIIRGMRVVTVQVSPFSYNPVTKELEVRNSIDLRVDFTNERGVNELSSEPLTISPAFANLLEANVVNFGDFRSAILANTPPRILIIHGAYADATFQSTLDAFVLWKRQKGAEVNVASFSTSESNESIKSYIQTQYNNASTRPDYIIIIGDTSGSFRIPTFIESYSSYNGEGDYPYTHLDGVDTLGDCFIGRISAETTAELRTILNKIYLYERDINIGTAAWLNRMLLVGDWTPSGISTIYISKYIKESALEINPNYTFTELYGSDPSVASMNLALNQGVGIFNYRGWLNMSGWSPGASLNNAYRLPHSVNITCGTGNFNSTGTTETFVRLGSESVPAGAVSAIGMATSGTHTGYNNTLDGGIFAGLLTHNMRTMGEALLHGRLYLWQIYGQTHTAGANYSAHWCNLIGDPSMEVFLGIPSTYQIVPPQNIPVGSNLFDVVVNNASGNPLSGQCVTLSYGNTILARGYSDEFGLASLVLPQGLQVGTAVITVSGHNYKPLQQDISIISGGLTPGSVVIDDDNAGQSIGNGNGLANAGERIELYLGLLNSGATSIRGLTGTISCSNPYISIVNPAISFPSIVAGATVSNTSPVIVNISAACPDLSNIRVVLNLTSQVGTQYTISQHIIVYNARLTLTSHQVIDGQNSMLDPDENAQLRFVLTNSGSSAISGLNAELICDSPFMNIPAQTVSYGNVAPAQQVQPASNFNVYVNALTIPGMVIPINVRLFNASGYEQIIPASFTVGNISVTDPLGPDAYGYVIYDMGDLNYVDCPTYSWVELAPAEGGSGTVLNINDAYASGNEGDQISSSYTAQSLAVVNLPFSFSFYGREYSQITVCSNGFIALGVTENAEFRNFRLPGAMGPSPMIAPFWDDLATNANSKVLTYYDSANHRFIVEWYRMLNGYNGSSEETFQVMLYDHLYRATSTGDGPILIQYKTFNNIDSAGSPRHGNYSTIGIQNHNQSVGLEYSYSNVYPTAAAPLTHERALYITTVPTVEPGPNMTIMSVSHNDTNGNGILESGESSNTVVNLKNIGDAAATNVTATLSTSDPYVTISNATVSYGTINALDTSAGSGYFQFSVSSTCPTNHVVQFQVQISGSNSTWTKYFSVGVYAPELELGTLTVMDIQGNQNGILDPGETVTIVVALNNNGGVASQAGSATLSCSTNGITVLTGSVNFESVPSNGSRNLSFSLRAAASMSIGSMASLVLNATAGSYSASDTRTLEVGAPNQVLIGTGQTNQTYPIDRYYNYSANESIYLASEIGLAGMIKSYALYKASGNDTNLINDVSIYMKHTNLSTLSTGNYSLDGYTLVYSGNYPNTATTGWMEVNLSPMFDYDGLQNLSILVVKGHQQYINSGYPFWLSSSTAQQRARQERSDSAAPINLTATNSIPDIRLKVLSNQTIFYPPQNVSAAPSNRLVSLSWNPPAHGFPSSYNIYRNNVLLANETGLFYHDVDVVNGTQYTYHLTSLFEDMESFASTSVIATPGTSTAQDAVLGSGSIVSLGNEISPVNISYKSNHGQSVYTAAELNAAGVYGPIPITQIGFYVVTTPNLPLPNFTIRMKHTSQTNTQSWHTAADLQTVYSNNPYTPTAGGWDMLTLSTPFVWNGVDNILLDTAFSMVSTWSNSGTLQYSTITSGYRFTRSDTADQTNVFTGGFLVTRRPNIKIRTLTNQVATISMPVTPINFGTVLPEASSVQSVTIQNTGELLLAGYILCPASFEIEASRNADPSSRAAIEPEMDRLGYRFTVESGSSYSFNIRFAPQSIGQYSGYVVVTTNADNSPVLNIPVSGSCIAGTLDAPVPVIIQSGNSVSIQWTAVPNATAYKVYKSNSPDGDFTLIGTTTNTSFTEAASDKAFYYIKATQSSPARESKK